jgi:hypothetical protein
MSLDALRAFAERAGSITGSTPCREGGAWVVRCPIHEADGRRHTPSLAVFLGDGGRIAFCCRAGCPWKDVADALRRHGLRLPGRMSEADRQQAAETAEQYARRTAESAARLWEEAVPFGRYVTATWYLGDRGLALTEHEARSFREANETRKERLLVAAIVDPSSFRDGRVQRTGVQTLALAVAGRPVLDDDGHKIRRTYGRLASNGVLLGLPGERIVVGEGVETTLSAMRILQCDSGLATLSAGNMPHISLPPNVRSVEIAADHDDAGRRNALALWQRLQQQGLAVQIAVPTCPGGDFNDVLLKRIRAADADPATRVVTPAIS